MNNRHNNSRSKRIVAAALSSNLAACTAQANTPDKITSLTNKITDNLTIELEPQPSCSYTHSKENAQYLDAHIDNNSENDPFHSDDDSVNDPNFVPSDTDVSETILYDFCEDIVSNHSDNLLINNDLNFIANESAAIQSTGFSAVEVIEQNQNASQSNEKLLFVATGHGTIYINNNILSNDIEESNVIAPQETIYIQTSTVNNNENGAEENFVTEQNTSKITEKIVFVAQYDGETYITNNFTTLVNNKHKLKHPFVLRSCEGKCKRDCTLFSNGNRLVIWNKYWDEKFQSRRSFLNKCIQFTEVKRRRLGPAVQSVNNEFKIKSESRFYYLPSNNDHDYVPVCKRFFLDTLGYKTDGVITELSRANKKGKLYASISGETRGGKRKVINKNAIQEHILSYKPAVSHYRRHNAPQTRYLPRELTYREMFADFKRKYSQMNCSDETYRKELKSMKISFNMPRGDKCDECVLYDEEKKRYGDESLIPVEIAQSYEEHKAKSGQALNEYKNDSIHVNSPHVKYFSMDLQKVILLPIMPQSKEAVFVSRLIAFNLTFAPINQISSDPATCVIWHEGQAGRDASNIVNAFLSFLTAERDCQHLHIWADNCTAQNKNWTLYAALVTILNCGKYNVESITISYLTKGHTHMTADSVHGNIERKIKKQGNLYDFADFKHVVESSRNKIRILELSECMEWPKNKRVRVARNDGRDLLKSFTLNKVVQAKFVSGSKNVFFKTSFEEQYTELDFLTKKYKYKDLPRAITTHRGIAKIKKEAIVKKLVPLMPDSRRKFWHDMPVNDLSLDLQTDCQECEEF